MRKYYVATANKSLMERAKYVLMLSIKITYMIFAVVLALVLLVALISFIATISPVAANLLGFGLVTFVVVFVCVWSYQWFIHW